VARFETPDEGNVNVRPYRKSDRRVLKEIHARANHGDKFPSSFRGYWVVTDDAGRPIMAAGAKLKPEITLICAPGGCTHPLVKLKSLSLLHNALRDMLAAKGHREAFASVPPHLVAYQRHLQRKFGWRESWTTFRIQDWKAKKDD
jgi:hypothetical protein